MPKDFNAIIRCAVVAVCLAVPGAANAQLFYNAELDKRAKAALEEYQASKKSHLAFLDARLADIDRQQGTLAAAALETAIAERDAAISKIFGEDERAGAPARLRGGLRARIQTVVPDIADADLPTLREFLRSFETGPDPLRALPSELREQSDFIKARFATAKTRPTGGLADAPTQAAWDVAWYCRRLYLPRTVDTADQEAAEDRFGHDILEQEAGLSASDARAVLSHSRDHCEEIVDAADGPSIPAFPNAMTSLAVKALSGRALTAVPSGPGLQGGQFDAAPALRLAVQMADVTKRTRDLKDELAAADKAAEALKKERKILSEIWSTNERQAQIALVACITQAVITETDPAACPNFKEVDPKGEMAAGFQTFDQVRAALSEFVSVGSDLETLKQGALFEVVQYLGDPKVLREKAETQCAPGGGTEATTLTEEQAAARRAAVRLCVTDAVMQGLNIVERSGEIRAGVPGRIAELAVTLAEAQMKAAQIRLRAAALARRAANLENRRIALISELQSLIPALMDDAGPGVSAARLDRAAFRLGESVRFGRADYARLTAEYGFIGQREFAERERAIVTSRYDIADSLLGTLAASAEGGIRPADVAALLSAVGITTLAVEKVVQ